MLDTTTFVPVGAVALPATPGVVPAVDFADLGGDAVATLGYDSNLQIVHAPIIGSPP